ncbi:hypothetical protein AVEN_53120-1, partial [Araneus ventricosus]
MENARKRVDVRLCNNGSKAEKKPISKPNFKDRTIYSETLVAFHMSKTVLTLNKPIVVVILLLYTKYAGSNLLFLCGEPTRYSRRLGRFYPLIPPRRTGNPFPDSTCLLSVFALLAVIGSFITALEYYMKEKFPKDQKCKSFFNCFCIFTNGEKILNTANSEGQFPCLHGIRFLSMNWVILLHTYVFQIPMI